MSAFAGPEVVEDGLVLALDAGNTKSYPGSGTTWSDLSGNGYNGIMNGARVSYSFAEKAFEFTGTTDASSQGIYIQNLNYVTGSSDGISNLTIESWVKCNSGTTSHTNDQRIIFSFDRSSVFRFAIGSDTSTASAGKPSLMFTNTSGNTDNYASSYSGDLRDNQWHQVCVTFSNTAVKYYVDGKLVHTSSGSFAPIGNQSTSETPRYGWIGNGSESTTAGAAATAPDDLFYGFISNLKYYYKTLTNAEIQQNFNALRGRFGI